MKSAQIIRPIAFTTALGFLGYYGWRHWPEVSEVLFQFGVNNITLAVACVVASLFCKALVNEILLRELLHTDLSRRDLLHSYTQSQIVKYIPGKIWGIMFQASTLQDNAKKGDVWAVNLYHFLLMNAVVVLVFVATVPFLSALGVGLRVGIVVAAIAGAAVAYFNFGRLLRLVKVDEVVFRRYASLVSGRVLAKVFAYMALDWLFYIGIWFALAWGQLSATSIVIMAINYATASVVGFLVFFLPSGLIAREAAFIAFGRALGDSTSTLLTYSVVVRLVFLLGDFLLVILTYFFKGRHGRSKEALG